eukprot:5479851-Heterocapsa_arctica.AAC.1
MDFPNINTLFINSDPTFLVAEIHSRATGCTKTNVRPKLHYLLQHDFHLNSIRTTAIATCT